MADVLRLTDANFETEVLESDLPVLVDFWASWCPPCKVMEPIVETLAAEYDGQLKVGKLNVDQNRNTPDRYRVLGLPTFAVFQAGKVVEIRVGAQSKAQLVGMLGRTTALE